MDTLWAIADKMRSRKEQGEFKTYRDAYRWAAINIPSSKVQPRTFRKLGKGYHKAKSEGKVGIKNLHSHYDNKSNEDGITYFGLE